MRKITTLFTVFAIALGLHANEGMWLPHLLKNMNEKEMQGMGMELTAEDLYSINKGSLKDAVVHFGGGCTSELVSPYGLMLTNHHCGYSYIQRYSTTEKDYLKDGFWAMKKEEEIACKGLTATLIVRIEDVTETLLEGIEEDITEGERIGLIQENGKKLTEEATKDTHYKAFIRSFYAGNQFYLFVTETFKDVRLVGAPPSGIGKFGHDTDNWMWPRHTGDFAVFRVYADKDNKPAEYAEENTPYKPKHHFPVSLEGIKKGDFTMVYGFPGRTQEYLTSYAVDFTMNVSNIARIKMREHGLRIIEADMVEDREIFIKYASKYARTSNYYKKWQGENRGLKKLNAVETKRQMEKEYIKRVLQKPDEYEPYIHLLDTFKMLYEQRHNYALARDYWVELVYYGPEIIRFANRFRAVVNKSANGTLTQEELDKFKEKQLASSKNFFKDYNQPTDRKVMAALLRIYLNNIDKGLRPTIEGVIKEKFKEDYQAYSDHLYDNSALTNQEDVVKLIEGASVKNLKKLKKDPAYQLMESIFDGYNTKVKFKLDMYNYRIAQVDRLWVQALLAVFPEKNWYPDANSTLRVAYGQVDGYEPANGVKYRHYTTLDGVIEKVDQSNYEFSVPQRLLDLYEKKDYGQYAQNGVLPVCFTANNHTTGGNSGSPVLNGKGHLIGINFDRAWESTMSDIMFDPDRCRNITVDIRYVLWVIDKYAGAGHLVEEMSVATATPPKVQPETIHH